MVLYLHRFLKLYKMTHSAVESGWQELVIVMLEPSYLGRNHSILSISVVMYLHRYHWTEKTQCSNFSQTLLQIKLQGWQVAYRNWHLEMGSKAREVVELVKAGTRHESVEVVDYQRGLMLLSTTGLELYDVLLFLLNPEQSVLINLIGLHYCLLHLGIQVCIFSKLLSITLTFLITLGFMVDSSPQVYAFKFLWCVLITSLSPFDGKVICCHILKYSTDQCWNA